MRRIECCGLEGRKRPTPEWSETELTHSNSSSSSKEATLGSLCIVLKVLRIKAVGFEANRYQDPLKASKKILIKMLEGVPETTFTENVP